MNFISFLLFLIILVLPVMSISIPLSDRCFTDPLLMGKPDPIGILNTSFEADGYQLITRYPHDTSAFTQGLVFYEGNLFESTGLLHKSGVRKINLNNGQSIVKSQVPDIYFGEGLTLLNHQIVQMSWKSGKIFFFHPETLDLIKKLNLEQEAWGSTTINGQLVISNGTSNLFFINSENLSLNKMVKITWHNKEISGLNALEYAEGYIFANVWPGHCIVKIDPDSGIVKGWLNLSKLVPDKHQVSDMGVLNGIAYDKQKRHFFVTGKFWPYLYEIKLQSNEY